MLQSVGLRGPQPRPAEARYSHSLIGRTTAGCDPNNLAEDKYHTVNSTPRPENGKNGKKCTYFVGYCNYLYYFWTKRSVEKDVNRVAVSVNVRNLQLDSNKRMSPSGRYHAPIGWSTSNALRHDGRGPLVL